MFDFLASPFVYCAAVLLRKIRAVGVHRLPWCKRVLLTVGVFPVRDHYYEPLFQSSRLTHSLREVRELPGIEWNIDEQLRLLDQLVFSQELRDDVKSGGLTYNVNNRSFESGDAEFWYNIVRLKKPKRIVEIGSGFSTLLAKRATEKNRADVSDYRCDHVCIEPYEMPWLENTGVRVIRSKVEEADRELFRQLDEGDILFIDSSHIIRPQGDVLLEYLTLLPSLKRGVVVHIHDIFSPRDYLDSWVRDEILFWNEQYLVEAFLTSNRDWKIVAALNLLHHDHYDRLSHVCPFLTSEREPGSLYIQKVG